jgi:hypothetical protein
MLGPIEIALAVPTCAGWIPERAQSLARLKEQLGIETWAMDPLSMPAQEGLANYREFREQESNRIWPTRMWRWGIETGASHLLQLQDDVEVSPNFWLVLRAMIEAQPDRLIGLHANHPLAPVQFRAGRRWYRDRWLTGPAYVFPTVLLRRFLAWCAANPELVESHNEDSLICRWCAELEIDVWHPVPTITDVDQSVPSTYGNDGHYEWSMHRRPLVTWRDATTLQALESPAWWACTEESAPLLPGPGTQGCWFCTYHEGKITSPKTGARICVHCVGAIIGNVLGRV